MLGYFIKASGAESGEVFAKYVWSFRKLFQEKINKNKYSKDVDLLLIEFTVEGRFIQYPQKYIRFRSYRTKEKSASVEVGVRKEFTDWPENEKKEFIIIATLNSIELAKNVFIRKGLDISGIPQLLIDLSECVETFRKMKIELEK